jgi:hypothetical protein
VLVFGLYNQITYVHVPPYELKGAYRQDEAFVREIEQRLPENAAVFQLPYLGFPETGRRVELFENDLLRGYLHSEDLRWSFGATKGRPADWADDLVGMPTATVVDAATAAGFSGLYVDRFGYPDRAAALEREVRARVGSEPLVSQSGRHSFFDLRAYRQRLEAAQPPERVAAFKRAVLEPFGYERNGFIRLEPSGGKWFAWARRATPELRIVNDSNVTRTAMFEATLDRVGGQPGDVVVTFPGAAPVTYRTPAPIRRELSLPAGESVIRFSTAAPEVPALRENKLRPHYFRLAKLDVTDTAFRPFVPVSGTPR